MIKETLVSSFAHSNITTLNSLPASILVCMCFTGPGISHKGNYTQQYMAVLPVQNEGALDYIDSN